MTNDALKKEFESIWAECRAALAEYRLDDFKKYVEIPENAPVPSRAEAQQYAEELPDLSKSKFLKLVVDGDAAGYYARTNLDGSDVTVAVIRFRKAGGGWQLAPMPDTLSIFSTDEKLNDAGVKKLIETKEILALRPGGAPAPAASGGGATDQDARPEPVIRKELEGIWKKIRTAFLAGKPGNAEDVLLWVDGATPPTPEEAKAGAKEMMPDLLRARFIKLVWSTEKPHLVGYIAEVNPGNAKKTTVAFIVFARKDGAWKFAPGPLAMEVFELPPTGQAALKKLVEEDSRFRI